MELPIRSNLTFQSSIRCNGRTAKGWSLGHCCVCQMIILRALPSLQLLTETSGMYQRWVWSKGKCNIYDLDYLPTLFENIYEEEPCKTNAQGMQSDCVGSFHITNYFRPSVTSSQLWSYSWLMQTMLALECFKATLRTSKLYTLNHAVTVALA